MRFSGERIRTAFRVVMWSTPLTSVGEICGFAGTVDVASKPCGSLWSLEEQGLESCALGKLCCCELLPLGVYPGSLLCGGRSKGEN